MAKREREIDILALRWSKGLHNGVRVRGRICRLAMASIWEELMQQEN
jgi:hypothetical protein